MGVHLQYLQYLLRGGGQPSRWGRAAGIPGEHVLADEAGPQEELGGHACAGHDGRPIDGMPLGREEKLRTA